jgi:hypothetical protein
MMLQLHRTILLPFILSKNDLWRIYFHLTMHVAIALPVCQDNLAAEVSPSNIFVGTWIEGKS